jgi:hypothetical protein
VKGCVHDGTYCEFKATASTNQQLVAMCINGANVQGAWTSCDYYGVVGDNMGILDGHVLDKDGGPVSGATVAAYGHPGATTTSDTDGFYAMQLKKGTYQVQPSGGPQGKASPSYTPRVAPADIIDGKTTHLDFTLDTSVELKLHFAKTSVVANGYEVVSGTITTTQYGKPLPNVTVQLEVKPSESANQAVTTGARASVVTADHGCGLRTPSMMPTAIPSRSRPTRQGNTISPSRWGPRRAPGRSTPGPSTAAATSRPT